MHGTFALAIKPVEAATVSQWAERERYVAEESGSPNPGKWRNDLAPYLAEVMDCAGLDHPSRKVVFKASAQTGKSAVGENTIGHTICQHPSPILLLLPSLDEVRKYVRIKLGTMIDSTPAVGARVLHAVSRDDTGSTMFFKRFRGGFLQVANAGSPKALQMISARLRIYEEPTGYQADVGGRGDPTTQADARSKAWQPRGDKVLWLGTPGVEGQCRITQEYEASDQRKLYVQCPHCEAYQILAFERLKAGNENEGAYFECAANGCIITAEWQRWMIGTGYWIKTYPARAGETAPPEHFPPAEFSRWRSRDSGGREPGFYAWQAYSPFVTWAATLQEYEAAKGDPIKLKAFWQQALGLAWRQTGEALDPDRLAARVESYPRGVVPAAAVVPILAVDVQRNRLEADVWACGRNGERWLVDHYGGEALDGRPDQPEVWAKLDALIRAGVEHASGVNLEFSKVVVDTGDGLFTQEVYKWSRGWRHSDRVMLVKGVPAYSRTAPVSGPTYVEVLVDGKKLKQGARLWTVTVDVFKGGLSRRLELRRPTAEELAAGAVYPAGYVHLCQIDDEWLRQLAAEQHVVTTNKRTGKTKHEWVKVRSRNEALDCAVYAEAAAWQMGIDRWTPKRWEQEMRKRNLVPAAEAPPPAPKLMAQAEPQRDPFKLAPVVSDDPRDAASNAVEKVNTPGTKPRRPRMTYADI